jgi:hypothetical protein
VVSLGVACTLVTVRPVGSARLLIVGGMGMRAFPVRLPSSVRYRTVVDDEYRVVGAADEYLQHLRFGRDVAESTTNAYAETFALHLRWCERASRDWRVAGRLGGFITWLKHTPADPDAPARGPGLRPDPRAGRRGSRHQPAPTAATRQSLLADLANLQEQNQRLRRQNLSLTTRLSEILGAELFHASGLGHPGESGQLRSRIAELEQQLMDLREQLQERTAELDAARAANRDLVAVANRKPVGHG